MHEELCFVIIYQNIQLNSVHFQKVSNKELDFKSRNEGGS